MSLEVWIVLQDSSELKPLRASNQWPTNRGSARGGTTGPSVRAQRKFSNTPVFFRSSHILDLKCILMVNGKWTALVLCSPVPAGNAGMPVIQPCTPTLMHQWVTVAIQGATSPIGSNLGCGVLPKDTSECGESVAGFKPPFRALDHRTTQLSQQSQEKLSEMNECFAMITLGFR